MIKRSVAMVQRALDNNSSLVGKACIRPRGSYHGNTNVGQESALADEPDALAFARAEDGLTDWRRVSQDLGYTEYHHLRRMIPDKPQTSSVWFAFTAIGRSQRDAAHALRRNKGVPGIGLHPVAVPR